MKYLYSILFFFLSLHFSCQSSSNIEKKAMVRVNIADAPKTLDPRKSRSLSERNIMSMLFDGLTRRGKEGGVELALAKEVAISEDKLEYTITLKDAYWSNGDLVSPKDFIYAWHTALSPTFPSENAYQLFCIENAKEIKEGKKAASELRAYEVDDKTLKITLTTPIPYFLELLSFPIFFPVHKNIDASPAAPVYCGPFMLREWKHNNFIEVIRNEKYFDAEQVKLSSIYMTMVEQETEIQMFENKELDWAGSPISTISLDRIKDLKEKKLLLSSPMSGTRFFRINVESYPLSNPNIRKALNLAINRKAIVEHIMQGHQKVALQFLPDSATTYFQDADIEKAQAYWKKGLEETNQTPQKFPKITLICASTHQNLLIAQAVQEDWRKALGIEVVIEANEAKVYFSRVASLDYQIALSSWIADYEDPESFLEVFKYKKDSVNNTGWESKQYISLLDSSRKLADKARKEELLRCESILMEDLPIIPLYHLSNHYVKNPSLQGVILSPLGGLDFKWAYLDSAE